jgi:hypothetical protein
MCWKVADAGEKTQKQNKIRNQKSSSTDIPVGPPLLRRRRRSTAKKALLNNASIPPAVAAIAADTGPGTNLERKERAPVATDHRPVGEKNHTSNARTRRRRSSSRSRIILPIPGVSPAIAECGRSKKGGLEDGRGKQAQKSQDSRGETEREGPRKLKQDCYLPFFLHLLPTFLPTGRTCLSSYLVQFLEFFRPVLGGNRVTEIFFFYFSFLLKNKIQAT